MEGVVYSSIRKNCKKFITSPARKGSNSVEKLFGGRKGPSKVSKRPIKGVEKAHQRGQKKGNNYWYNNNLN
jgi:hypothetical protein